MNGISVLIRRNTRGCSLALSLSPHSSSPTRDWTPGPQQQKCQALTTGLPGNSLYFPSFPPFLPSFLPIFLSFFFFFLYHVKIQRVAHKPENWLSPQPEHAGTLMLGVQPPALWEISIRCLSLPSLWYLVIAAQTKTYNNTKFTSLYIKVGSHLCPTLYFYLNCVSGKWDQLR